MFNERVGRRAVLVGAAAAVPLVAAGCTIGVMKGPADWAGADARRLIRAALGRPG